MTIEEAKKVYKKYNCSLFAMAREDKKSYDLYKELNIKKNIEMKWKGEVIEELVFLLKETGESRIFNQLYDLTECFHDKEKLKVMIDSIEDIKVDSAECSLCIAETIIGRKMLTIRSGMIFWAYDVGAKKEALELIDKAKTFINTKTSSVELKERARRDMETIDKIIDILKLKK